MDQAQNQPAAPQQPAPAPAPAPAQQPPLSEADQKDIQDNKLMAVISYFSILFLVPMFLAKNSKFAQFHAKQGLILFVAEVILNIVGMSLRMGGVANIIGIVISIYAAVQAWNGKYWEMPYLGQYAKKINL